MQFNTKLLLLLILPLILNAGS